MKKIVAIVGTYRKDRVIDTAVSEVLRGAEGCGVETERIYLIDKQIEFCRNCRACTQEADVGRRGQCVLNDDMEQILRATDEAGGIVLASPTNFYNVTAITRRFMERLVIHAYWPWRQGAPKVRDKTKDKNAVTITSTACPALIARIAMPGAKRALKTIANTLGAKVQTSLFFGMAAQTPDATLGEKDRQRAFLAGRRLARSIG